MLLLPAVKQHGWSRCTRPLSLTGDVWMCFGFNKRKGKWLIGHKTRDIQDLQQWGKTLWRSVKSLQLAYQLEAGITSKLLECTQNNQSSCYFFLYASTCNHTALFKTMFQHLEPRYVLLTCKVNRSDKRQICMQVLNNYKNSFKQQHELIGLTVWKVSPKRSKKPDLFLYMN